MVEVRNIESRIMKIFEHLHTHPEISWKETETTEYLKNILVESGCNVRTFVDCTGVIGEIGEGKPVVAIRADMDALWQEVDGKFQANHSCGHDSHMTMVLGVLLSIKEMADIPNGTIRFIFQPAEEKGTGALKMVEENVVDDVDFLYGVHLRPIQEVRSGMATPALFHGAARHITGEVLGEDTHGARPHLGVNAIEIGAELVQRLNHIHADPMIPHSVKFTKFQAGGESANIIPGNATFSIDLRAQTNDMIEKLTTSVEDAVKSISDYYHVPINLSLESMMASAIVDPEAQEFMADSIRKVLGEENLVDPVTTTGSEDFHFYTLKKNHIKASVLGLGCDLKPGLHHPNMSFDHQMLMPGVQILTNTVLETLAHLANSHNLKS
ncbi:M20 peptidase aminoacylase family protein [Halobacillus amylolyticus]|uniref:M20 peptidase aminoacylase family protein n=1 Tax=Halobacillus amylolyticus TaxID=2932259 RepID=A0ABY4H9K7_9BACI|nr:M20 peptidase aminoacylase family protein [Halobacillus amylolyticus]UOR11357.1 M20 peptidase aminoacylase family protein [Halobacillus amylolyticus]